MLLLCVYWTHQELQVRNYAIALINDFSATNFNQDHQKRNLNKDFSRALRLLSTFLSDQQSIHLRISLSDVAAAGQTASGKDILVKAI